MVKQPTVKTSSRELAYRTDHYHDIKVIKDRQILCASCGNHVIIEAGKIFSHPVIGTLQCEKCWDHFNNIDFSSDEDHIDKYCRLCANTKNLYTCKSANCTLAFCKRCIKRNAPLSLLDIERKNWKCFVCESKPLWELRAVCASVMDCLSKKNKKNMRGNLKIHHDSILPYKRYQSMQVKKIQKALRSICDEEDEECDYSTDKKPSYHKSNEKEKSNVHHITQKQNKCDESIPSKKSTSYKLCNNVCPDSSSDVATSSDTEIEFQRKTCKATKNQSQRKLHLSNSKSDINDFTSDELNKTKSSKLSDTYTQKKNKSKTETSSCKHTSNSEQSEQGEQLSRIKRHHRVIKQNKVNVNKFSDRGKKSNQISSDSESEEENLETGKKKVKTLSNKSNKKKCYIKQSDNESDDEKIISQSLTKIDADSSSGREFQKTKLVRSSYSLLRKKHDKQVHVTSTKKNVISKQQWVYFKSYIIETLDELKQQCSVFELEAEHIEYKCEKKPMYLEDTEKIIYKSKSAVNKVIMDFKNYEKNLVNFYKSFVLSIKDEEHESSDDETVLINKKHQKRKYENGKPKSDNKSDIVSDCDSDIFSGNDTSSEITKLENSSSKNEISSLEIDECLSKSLQSTNAISDTANTVEPRATHNVSPVLGKQLARRKLSKSTDNSGAQCNVNNDTSDIPNNVTRDDLSNNCTDESIIKDYTSENDPKNKSDRNLSVTNNSLNDLFASSFESENEISKFDTVTNKTHDLDINSILKENNVASNTKPNELKKNNILSLNSTEINSSRKEDHNYANIFEQKTQEISNKFSGDSERIITTKDNSEKDTASTNITSHNDEIIETPKTKKCTKSDSDISNISDIPSTKIPDKSDDSLNTTEKNTIEESKSERQTDIESDCSTVILPDLDKSDITAEDTSDNIEQSDTIRHELKEDSLKERILLDTESNETIEERIKNALLESDSDDSILSSPNKEIEMNREICNTDLSKIQPAMSDNGSTKSDKSCKSLIQVHDPKLHKSSAQKRNYDLESDSSVGSRVKRRRLQLQKNYYYMNDKKLRMICHVQIEKLQDTILHRYKHALQKSKEYQDDKKLKSLIDLDALEKTTKKKKPTANDCGTSQEDNKLPLKSLKMKKKAVNEEEEDSLMDHLKKIQDGNIPINTEDDSDNNDQNLSTTMDKNSVILTNDDLILEADNVAKKLLLNSSDSNLDDDKEETILSDNKNEDEPKEKIKNIKQKDIKKDDEELSEENEEKRLKKQKSKWRRNKILTMKISDSDSEKEKEKWEKSQQKLNIKEEDSDKDNINIKRKTNKNRRKKIKRIIDSDSDVKEIKSESSDSDLSKSTSDVQILSSSDCSSDEKQKKKLKRQRAKKSSDTESSVTGNKPKPKRRRIKNVASDSNSDSDEIINSPGKSSKLGRKNIRKVLKDKQVAADTKQAAKEEEERLKRIMERQKLYNEMYETRLAGEEKVEKLVLDFNTDTKEELVTVNSDLVKRLKPHQAQGIKFMWDACFESLERIKTTSGSGCIIAHCMGLGKTLQVITLAHTLLTYEATGVKTILVVCPLSTVLNWANEFNMWLKDIKDGDIDVYELTKCKKNFERKYKLQYWHTHGGVLIIGYEMFRNLTGPNKSIRKNMKEAILQCLIDPGPDLIVCDEGHLLKNEDTALSKCMKRVKTLRRIVLTGTPLQNNLIEYHCMVQFVKPNLLGSKREFLNRFANPITNGQFDNSTEYDVKLMKKRAHVLHKLLQGSVQRFDYSVLTPFLPPKQEYVIFVRLTDVQIKLYQYYLDNFARPLGLRGTLFADFQALQRIWTHPVVLRLNAEKVERANEKKRLLSDSEGSLRNFVVSDEEETSTTTSDSDSDIQSVHSTNSASYKPVTRSTACENGSETESVEIQPEKEEWWSQFIEPEHFNDMRISAKLVLLFGILKECEKIGDKVLVFSQSLYSLTLIEQFLSQIDDALQNDEISENLDGHTGSWSLGLDYFRLDGQTSPENRNVWCKIFNRPTNTRARLFLISTRAGGLGINLTAANRVIIFDASWNPSHDIQSIFRVYRFGQKKPCYVYRFLAAGTMEEKIYNRQVTKLSLSCRVVDEQQIERHYSHNALNELYKFEPHTNTDKPTLNLPKDRLLAEIFLKYKDSVENYHEHDSLLENKADEELDEEERKQAWLEYEEEKKGIPQVNSAMVAYQNNVLLQQYNMMANLAGRQNNMSIVNNAMHMNDYENLQKLIEKDYPNATPEQRKLITTRALVEMYNYWEQQAIIQPNRNSIIAQNMQPNMQQNMRQNIQPNIQQNTTLLPTTNSTNTANQTLLRHLTQSQPLTYNPNSANTNPSNLPLKDRVVNPYVYPKASTSSTQPGSEIPRVTIDFENIAENTAKTAATPTSKEQEE